MKVEVEVSDDLEAFCKARGYELQRLIEVALKSYLSNLVYREITS